LLAVAAATSKHKTMPISTNPNRPPAPTLRPAWNYASKRLALMAPTDLSPTEAELIIGKAGAAIQAIIVRSPPARLRSFWAVSCSRLPINLSVQRRLSRNVAGCGVACPAFLPILQLLLGFHLRAKKNIEGRWRITAHHPYWIRSDSRVRWSCHDSRPAETPAASTTSLPKVRRCIEGRGWR